MEDSDWLRRTLWRQEEVGTVTNTETHLFSTRPEEERTTCWHLHGNQRRKGHTSAPVHSFITHLSVPTPLFPQRDDDLSKCQTPSGRLVLLSVCASVCQRQAERGV